jgi:putative transposase
MQLVERHIIDRNDPRYKIIDDATFASKNLYNAALYIVRQSFIFEHKYLNYNKINKLMQSHDVYKKLPGRVAQWVLRGLHYNWISYFKACEAYREQPEMFLGHPKLPGYKDKLTGRNLLVYTDQAISKMALKKRGVIQPSGLPINVKTVQKNIDQVRIIPRHSHFVVEVVYEKEPVQVDVNSDLCAGMDLGVTNLAAITSNKRGFVPRLVNGRPLKAYNQWYNKRMKELKKQLPKDDRGRYTRQMEKITTKRTRCIDHYLHTVSRQIINLLVEEGIGTLIIGKNDYWKQGVNRGKINNQNFCYIPHERFIRMLTYKANLVGIQVELTEESYTSKASFLDLDLMPVYKPNDEEQHRFSGRRVKRGLYQAKDGRCLNSDVNGAYNIIRKCKPNAFMAKGVVDAVVVHPVWLVHTKPMSVAIS